MGIKDDVGRARRVVLEDNALSVPHGLVGDIELVEHDSLREFHAMRRISCSPAQRLRKGFRRWATPGRAELRGVA